MEEQVKANPWGDQAKEVEKEVFVETPKSNKLTYILIGLGALLVLAVGVLGFVVYKQAMTNPPSSTSTSSVSSSKLTTSSSTSSSVSTSSNTASVSVSSAITSKYYKYNTNNGKYISFDYPDGASINIEGSNGSKISALSEISSVNIKNSLVDVTLFGGASGTETYVRYTYDVLNPNQITWEGPIYYNDGDNETQLETTKGTINLNTGSFVFVNDKIGYAILDLTSYYDKQPAAFKIATNTKFVLLEKQSNGKYITNLELPKQSKVKLTKKLNPVEDLVLVDCKAINTEDVKKCTEVIDRFVTTFKVK